MTRPEDAGLEPRAPRPAPVTLFVSDPTAEAERVAHALRAEGYLVVDVPLSMLVARVSVQHPRVILVDADAENALDVIERMRELPDAEVIHVLLLGRSGGAVGNEDEALAHEASGLFIRPVDLNELAQRVRELAGPPALAKADTDEGHGVSEVPRRRSSVPSPASARPTMSRGSRAEGLRDPEWNLRALTGASLPPPSRRPPALAPLLGPELRQLLVEAEQRVAVGESPDPPLPSPAEELEALLPAELLAALDEPLEEHDESDAAPLAPEGVPGYSTPSAPALVSPITNGGTHSGSTGSGSGTGGSSLLGDSATGPSGVAPPTSPVGTRPAERSFPAVVGAGEALGVLARAVAARVTGSFAFAVSSLERRVVLREGDIAIAVSGAEDESLLAFLGARGDLPRETVRRLSATVPLFGRHAGAALVARGYVLQDQLWPTLRAHAEWILARVLQGEGARLVVEPQPPGRLQGEPGVFGGSPGAAVVVEVARRVVAPEYAVERLGGPSSRLAPGPMGRLLNECALAPSELAQVRSVTGRSVGEALEAVADAELAPLLLALSALGVLEVVPSPRDRSLPEPEQGPQGVVALDAEAIRERVRARMQLVEEGDYFALLGIARDATGYEVRRAFLELRRAFEPSRALTAETTDLADGMRKIAVVLEEAYEILKDAARRERYRRAIEAVPGT